MWTGYGGDANWSNPLNWSGSVLPQTTDDVLLDNSDMPVSYFVTLPDAIVLIRTLHISPSPGRVIELVLPSSNKITEAFTVTGPGYGIELNAGAVFRNASGLTSGESLRISDSMIIHDGGRYIHQTRASHANGILNLLSKAPGTEQGIFDFDVPRASYTISISNRTYGSLELHSSAFGNNVNYTCTGSNPLLIRGNLRIGPGVNTSIDLAGPNGNIQVEGDFIQEGGQLNLASGAGDNTVLRVKGDIYQSAAGVITETANGTPFLELNGKRLQEVAMAGQMINQVGFRMNNTAGAALRLPLTIPFRLDLIQGPVFSTATALLIIGEGAGIKADSTTTMASHVEGPLRKLNLILEDHFLFPVGKQGNLRWLELKEASGNYTVEYFHQDPSVLGNVIGTGLDHISKLEYWTVTADGVINNQAKIELSFAYNQSGVITDPNFLNIAKFQSMQWEDAGHGAITGNYLNGSVQSGNIDFIANAYTLASVLNLENPLPITDIFLEVKELPEGTLFKWTIDSPEKPDHFELIEITDGLPVLLTKMEALNGLQHYSWFYDRHFSSGNHYFRISMFDKNGIIYSGKIVLFHIKQVNTELSWISEKGNNFFNQVLIRSEIPDEWKYEIISIHGKLIKQGVFHVKEGRNYLPIEPLIISGGIYIFKGIDGSGKMYSLLFRKT